MDPSIGGEYLARPAFRDLRAARAGRQIGHEYARSAVVILALISILLTAIDVGRAIYLYAELNDAVHEGARYGALYPGETTNIKNRVIEKAPGLSGLRYSNIEVICPGGCDPEGFELTISASYAFEGTVSSLLGFGPITITSSERTQVQ